jgi:hypothetical protein
MLERRTVEHRNVRGKTDGQERDSFTISRDTTNRRRPREYRNANLRKEDLQRIAAIDPNAQVEINSRGAVKLAIYFDPSKKR